MNDGILQPLTSKEKRVLEFIEDFWAKEGLAPSFSEIKDNFGFASYNSVQRYLKQLQRKGYIHIPGGNQKRAITVLRPASAVLDLYNGELLNWPVEKGSDSRREAEGVLSARRRRSNEEDGRFATDQNAVSNPKRDVPYVDGPHRGPKLRSGLRRSEQVTEMVLSLPLLGQVAAGLPLEDVRTDEYTDVPASMVRRPKQSFTLRVKGQSMIEDGIFDGDILIIQEQSTANNGETVVATVDNEATVKRFYLHSGPKIATPQVELRPANSEMESMWYEPHDVEIRGIVVGLLRKF